MKYKDAKKLHNHDQITVKITKEVTEVISIEIHEKNVYVNAMTDQGYSTLNHKEIS